MNFNQSPRNLYLPDEIKLKKFVLHIHFLECIYCLYQINNTNSISVVSLTIW